MYLDSRKLENEVVRGIPRKKSGRYNAIIKRHLDSACSMDAEEAIDHGRYAASKTGTQSHNGCADTGEVSS